MTFSKDRIRNIVNQRNHEAGFLKHSEHDVEHLVEWLRESGGEATWDSSRVEADDAELALAIYRMERSGPEVAQ